MKTPVDPGLAAARDVLERIVLGARSVTAFTGAGLSTECGVPDFRSPGSPWLTHPPIPFDQFLASAAVRAEAWRRKFALDDANGDPAPGRGHLALSRLCADGRVGAVVTQNIDGLHSEAGVPADRLVELHGNGGHAACLACGRRYELAVIRPAFERSGLAPMCECGGPVKTATIAFGQNVPARELARARDAALACDVFLVLGSSLLVRPAATLPVLAARNGATLVIVNRTATPLDAVADTVLRQDIGDILSVFTDG